MERFNLDAVAGAFGQLTRLSQHAGPDTRSWPTSPSGSLTSSSILRYKLPPKTTKGPQEQDRIAPERAAAARSTVQTRSRSTRFPSEDVTKSSARTAQHQQGSRPTVASPLNLISMVESLVLEGTRTVRGQPRTNTYWHPENCYTTRTMTTTTRHSTAGAALINVNRVTGQHTLLLMRHAKSSYPPGVADHERPLAPRGIREAGLAGDWLRANVPAIDAVLCSTATRARQTLAKSGIDATVRYSERLYGATPGMMIDEINGVADTVNTLLVVGHEPTVSDAGDRPGGRRRYRCGSGGAYFGKVPDVGDRGARPWPATGKRWNSNGADADRLRGSALSLDPRSWWPASAP